MFPADRDPYDAVIACQEPPEGSNKLAMLDAVDASLVPCKPAVVARELARMKLVMASRGTDGHDAEAWLLAVVDELARFPEDVVVEACRTAARTKKWLPTLSEIVTECSRMIEGRKAMQKALSPW